MAFDAVELLDFPVDAILNHFSARVRLYLGWRADAHGEVAIALVVGRIAGRGDQVVAALWVVPAEYPDGRSVEGAGIPLALDGVHFITAAGQDEIHLASRLVAPVAKGRIGKMGLQMFKHEMLPERTEIGRPKRIPPAREAHEAGVETVDLGLLDDLVLAAAVERMQDGDGMGDLQGMNMALHRGARNAQRRRGYGRSQFR